MLIILDAGHGKDTKGKSYKGFEEWLFNRNVVKYISYELKLLNVAYHILVPDDKDVPLSLRTKLANEVALKYKKETGKESSLISVHGNAFQNEGVSGLETFYYSKKGRIIAGRFQRHLVDSLGWKNRGVKKANFWIIKNSAMPAVLTESGFYTNDKEREFMSTSEGQYQIAMAHVEAIKEML